MANQETGLQVMKRAMEGMEENLRLYKRSIARIRKEHLNYDENHKKNKIRLDNKIKDLREKLSIPKKTTLKDSQTMHVDLLDANVKKIDLMVVSRNLRLGRLENVIQVCDTDIQKCRLAFNEVSSNSDAIAQVPADDTQLEEAIVEALKNGDYRGVDLPFEKQEN